MTPGRDRFSVSVDARRTLLEKYLRGNQALSPLPARVPGQPVPLSFGQQQLWLLSQLIPDPSVYNESVLVHIPNTLDIPALERSLNEVVRRHEAWRTSFPLHAGEPVQLIHPALHLPLPVVDLSHEQSTAQLASIQRIAREQAHLPFDLANGPLLRFVLIRLAPQEHRLCMTLHHIIFDGVAIYQVFLSELSSLYQAFADGQPSPLPELRYQYADFALWQRNWLEGERMEQQLAYWKERLAGASTTLELPTDHPRPPVQSYRGSVRPFTLPTKLVDVLKSLSQREGGTLYMTIVAAFNLLLYRYTGQEDLLLGTGTISRRRSEFEGLLGYFLNTLVLRSDLSGDPTFRELLGRVRETIIAARSHEDVPFEYVVKALHPERTLERNPIFQVLLTFVPPQPTLASGWSLSQLEVHTGTSKFDLYLELDERAEGLVGRFVYNSDLFDEATIARMAVHFQKLLEAIAAHPECQLSALSMLTEQERQQLLVEWNRSEIRYAAEECLHTRFEEQVERDPEATALVCDGTRLSYGELNGRANRLARVLQRLRVGPDTLVGICVERSVEMVVGLLGILKAGGAYVPLDPTYPAERLAFILRDSAAPVLLTQQKLLAQLPSYDGKMICLDSDWERIAREDNTNLALDMDSSKLAYVIYTSGSTGLPKGVLVSHANVVRLFAATQDWYHFDEHDVWTLFHSYAFDFSVWELWGALLYGGRLVVVSYWTSRAAEAFYELLQTERVTVLNQTPSAFYQLIQAEEAKGVAQDLALRLVIFGGEALEFQRLIPWFERHGAQTPRLVNMYGITETTVHVSYYPLSQADAAWGSVSLIGRPIPDLQLYLLDQQRQLVPVGVPGEMYVGGAGLARGYLNRPELDASRFITHSFGDGPAVRLYRTGDLARYHPNGTAEFLGRIDQQVKIRGFRIELGEIEAALLQHPAIQQAAVVAREDTPGEKRLVAYIVGSQEAVQEDLHLTHLPNQQLVYHLNHSETGWLYDEIFVERSYLRHGITVAADACIFDVGANIGLFTLFAHQHYPAARIYAFEPLPPIYRVLRSNVELYGLDTHLFPCGLADEAREAQFTYYPHWSAMSGRYADAAQDAETTRVTILNQDAQWSQYSDQLLVDRFSSESYTCQLRTLSEVMHTERIERIDLLKIDVERSELDVLNGIQAEDWPKIRQLAIEVHAQDGHLARIQALLRAQGYSVVCEQPDVLEHTDLYSIYAVRNIENASSNTSEDLEPAPSLLLSRRLASATELRRFLHSKLPEYMVPSAFVSLDTLPLTTNGKLDRRALPAPGQDRVLASAGYVAPHLPLQQQLVAIWEELIDARPIGIRDNFFDLGGHSLLAARMVNRIEQVCGKGIPLSTLFAGATIEHLASALSAEEPAQAASPIGNVHVPFVKVQGELSGKTKQPFFFLHGDWLYGAYYCMDLARALGPDQPFYVLEPYVFDEGEDLPTLEEMAAAHLETMRAIQPEGPYVLGGWCNGGLLAYEMARQLDRVGQCVELLVLMDPAVPFLMNRAISPLQRSGRSIVNHAGQFLHVSHRKRYSTFLRFQHVYRSLRYSHYRSRQKGQETHDHWGHLFEWISGSYVPRGYRGKLTIFWDSEDLYRRASWQHATRTHRAEVHIIPGTHITCRTDHLGDLAACLKLCLEKTY